MVYVARNPKDVIVSFFHHHKLTRLSGFQGDMETFADYFIKDERESLDHHNYSPKSKKHLNGINILFVSSSHILALLCSRPGSVETAPSCELALRVLRRFEEGK